MARAGAKRATPRSAAPLHGPQLWREQSGPTHVPTSSMPLGRLCSRGGSSLSLSRSLGGGAVCAAQPPCCCCCCDEQHGWRANGSRQTGRDDQAKLHGGSAGMEVGSQPGSSRATPHHGSLRWACRLPSRAGRNLQEFVGLAAPSTRSAPSPRDMSSASRTFLPRSPAARASARTRPGALAGRCLGRAIAPLGAAWPRQSLTPQPCR